MAQVLEIHSGTEQKQEAQPGAKLAADNQPTDPFPGGGNRPCWGVYDNWLKRGDKDFPPGVYWHEIDGGTEKNTRICDPLHVIAQTRDETSNAWGRLLEWKDADGMTHGWAMPMSLLEGDGADMRRELAHQGLRIAPGRKPRELLEAYVKDTITKKRARCVERLGWHGRVYVTPGEVIGKSDDVVVFQNASAAEPAFATAGTVKQWRDTVGKLATGNSRLQFAISLAFAAPLAELADEDSGGFHYRGVSSSGKSTALKAAASVWGKPKNYVRLWRATANGLEGIAALHNDNLLILDELSQIDGKEAGQCAYMLANGQGKTRAARTGAARQPARWRLLFLSAGEVSLAALMAADGRRANAGQEIRLADIDADAGAGLGIFDTLNGYANGGALATAIKDAANTYYGAVGLAWLHHIVSDRANVIDTLNAGIPEFIRSVVPADAVGQVERVARRFALVAVAGELATHYKLTGWKKGEANAAAKTCFESWLEGFGGAGNREERAILSQVRAFFEAHGASRFEDMAATADQRILNRVGFYRTDANGEREFIVLSESFRKEVCQGLDERTVKSVLLKSGMLIPGKDGKPSQNVRLPGLGSPKTYVIRYTGDKE